VQPAPQPTAQSQWEDRFPSEKPVSLLRPQSEQGLVDVPGRDQASIDRGKLIRTLGIEGKTNEQIKIILEGMTPEDISNFVNDPKNIKEMEELLARKKL